MIHVNNWYKVRVHCRWAGSKLPTVAGWELAVSAEASPNGSTIASRKRLYPWGDSSPTPRYSNLDGRLLGPVDVVALSEGDRAFGLR